MPKLAEAQGRLARHYLTLAQVTDDKQDFQALDADWLQIRAILADGFKNSPPMYLPDLVEMLNFYWDARGLAQEWIHWSKQALEACITAADYRGVSNHVGRLGNAYHYLGRVEQAIKCHQHALAIAQEINDKHWEGTWLGNLGL